MNELHSVLNQPIEIGVGECVSPFSKTHERKKYISTGLNADLDL